MAENKICLFCNEYANYSNTDKSDDNLRVNCPNCGTYFINDIMEDQDKEIVKAYTPYKHLISGLIREKSELGLKPEVITQDNVLSLLNDSLIPRTIMQRLDKILLYLSRKSKIFGKTITVNKRTPYACGYANSHEELLSMIQTLIEYNFLSKYNHGGDMIQVIITLKGISRIEELLTRNTNSNKVFVAMEFKNDLLEAHRMAIQPACIECGFVALLTIDKEYNGDITDRIISEIKTSKFVISDFTYNNQGAYFEAGYAQGRGLEVIRICKKQWFDGLDDKGEKNHLHFDINHYNFILWEDYKDLKEKLINRIRATIL